MIHDPWTDSPGPKGPRPSRGPQPKGQEALLVDMVALALSDTRPEFEGVEAEAWERVRDTISDHLEMNFPWFKPHRFHNDTEGLPRESELRGRKGSRS